MALDLGVPKGLELGSLDFQNAGRNPDLPSFIHSLLHLFTHQKCIEQVLGAGEEWQPRQTSS